jgi:hypothetical protein
LKQNIHIFLFHSEYLSLIDALSSENAAISYGEYLHCVGDFQMAAQVYEKIHEAFCMDDVSGNLLAAGNMVSEEASLGATCSYGQLLSHSG